MVVPAAGSGAKVRVQGSSSCYRHPLPTSSTRRGRHRCGSRVRDTARSPRGSACSLRDGRPRSFVRGTAPPRPASDGSRCRGAAHSGRRQSRGRGNSAPRTGASCPRRTRRSRPGPRSTRGRCRGSTPRGPGETDGRESTGPRRHGGHRGLPAPRRATSDARTATKVVVLFDPGIPSGNGAFIEGESFSSDGSEPRKCNLDPAGWDSGSWSPSEKFAIQEDLSEEFLLDVRHLWVRSQKMTGIFRVRHTVFGAVHEYFREHGFWEVHPPMITPAGSEGGATLFEVDYFGRKAFLTQSWQLYAEALVLGMEKIYYVGPSFRAEKSRTTRHLTEYWHAEMEEAWVGMDAVIRHAEGVISQACALVAEERVEDIVALGRTPEFLKAVKPPFERMTYDEALKVLKAKGIEVEWGKDLRTLEERALTEGKSRPVIVTHYPRVSQAFYKARDPEHLDLVLGFDVIGGDGVGEIVGGSERETDLETIKKALLEQGEDPKSYDWYLDSRRFGSVQHAGFGLGMERLIQWICKLGHIRDAVPFPRTPGRFSP